MPGTERGAQDCLLGQGPDWQGAPGAMRPPTPRECWYMCMPACSLCVKPPALSRMPALGRGRCLLGAGLRAERKQKGGGGKDKQKVVGMGVSLCSAGRQPPGLRCAGCLLLTPGAHNGLTRVFLKPLTVTLFGKKVFADMIT